LGGRHGSNRRGRDKHKRRDRGDKKANGGRDGAPPKGTGPFRATALTVINRRSQALDCTFFFRIKTGLDDYDLPTANGQRSLAPQESFRYDHDRYRAIASAFSSSRFLAWTTSTPTCAMSPSGSPGEV
jgi:hypothetical protein